MLYFLLPPLLWRRLSEGMVGALARYPLSVNVLKLATMDGGGPYEGRFALREMCRMAGHRTVFTEINSVLRNFNSTRLKPDTCNAWLSFR